MIDSAEKTLLQRMAKRYVWWKAPDAAMARPDRIIAQVMDIGDFEDTRALVVGLGEDRLRAVIRCAEAGQFSARSWAYWHYRLGLAEIERVPERPERIA